MQRPMRPDGLDTTVGTLRSPSISSDVMSSSAKSLNGSLPLANPPPAYIAANGASNLLSSELDRTVIASPQALALVNEFLDQVLYNILATSRSVTLQSLRAAVPSVLKPRLGKAAVRAAEEDLNEYLEDEEETETATKTALDPRQAFDTELAWKLARLRCMVYAQLGDLEEEEEEEWLEAEQLLEQVDARKDSFGDIQLGPAAAIFLASVIEYLGEQALYYAAQHAQKRMTLARAQANVDKDKAPRSLTPKTDEIVLEGKDMNHVGRDSPLSRLWRSWRRNTRDASSRQMSPEMTSAAGFSPSHSRTGSQAPGIHEIAEEPKVDALPPLSPSQIPLPLGENDIDEIEVPGLADVISDTEEDDSAEAIDEGRKRPVSMTIMPGSFPDAPASNVEDEDESAQPDAASVRPFLQRQRSMSSPTPVKQHFSLWRSYPKPLVLQSLQTDPQGLVGEADGETEAGSADPTQEMAVGDSVEPRAVSPTSAQSNQSPQTPQSASVAARRGRNSPQEPGSPNKRDGMVGGPLEAAIGAAGAAGAAANMENQQRKKSLSESETTSPNGNKKTVAEEIMCTQNAVAPPKDAHTGASITNVADFDSMYVPMQMPAKKEQRGRAVEAPQQTRPQHKTSASQSSISKQLLQRKPLPAEPVEDQQPPVPVLSPSIMTEQNQTNKQLKERITASNNAQRSDIVTSVLTVKPQHYDSPVSPLPVADQRPPTSGSTVSAEAIVETPATPPDALRSHPPHHMHAASQHSLYSQRSKSSSSSSRAISHSREQSVKPPPLPRSTAGSADESPYAVYSPAGSRATRENRPSTASSSTSKLVGKAPTPVHNAIHNVQRSEDIDANKKKSLEILIRSNETLHYTLTPANVMQSPQSPKRSETQDMADFLRNTGPPTSENSRPQVSTNDVDPMPNRSAMVRSPVGGRIIPASQDYPRYSSPTGRRNPLGEARDPRAERSTNMRELADYARSTGPLDESQLPQALSTRPPVKGSVRNALANQPRQPVTNKSQNRTKLEARDPRPSRTADNSDLIDFIREGPPRAPGEHRIDRRVAPFRTTMDSEDLNSLAPNIDKDSSATYSVPSAYDERSADPSINSQTALLTSTRRPPNGNNYSHTSRSQPLKQTADDGMPQRTRRRVKDPYAIYDSGDDDDFGQGANNQHTSNEESLIDFLRNTAPPPGSAPQPILGATGYTSSGAVNRQAAREGPPQVKKSGARLEKSRPTDERYGGRVNQPMSKPQYEAREARPRRNDTSDLADYLRNSGPPPSNGMEPQPFQTSQTQAYQQQRDDNGLMRMFTKRKIK